MSHLSKILIIGGLSLVILIGLWDYSLGAFPVFNPNQGGTGTSAAPSVGDILVGQSGGVYAPQATSTLGIEATPAGSDTQVQFNSSGSFGASSAFTWINSTQNLIISTTTVGLIAFEPDIDQTITTSTATIISSRSHIDLTMNGDFLLTSTPSIAAGIDGQLLILHSQSTTSTLDFQDDSILSGSDIFLNGASGTLKPASSMMLIYQASAPIGWTILSNPNTAALGGDASLLSVRNVSGGSIAAGKVVHIDGFNVGLGRPTIVLADADVPALMPAIGITATAIANGQNGQVILSGNAIGLIDTSGASVGDGVWVSTTAGEVVFVRPTVDEIQRLGEVDRSHATGNIIIHGAGRSNDIPINATTTGTYNFGNLFVTGNVGIGTTTPQTKFHLVGTPRWDLGSDATSDIFFRNSSGNVARLAIGADGKILTASSTASGGLSWEEAVGGLWTDAGDFTYLTATDDDLVIGSDSTSTAPFWIDVSASTTYVKDINISRIFLSDDTLIEKADIGEGFSLFPTFSTDPNQFLRLYYSASRDAFVFSLANLGLRFTRIRPTDDSTWDVGTSVLFWDETYTDELILQQGTIGSTAADQVRLAGLDLSAGDSGLHIKTENDTEHLFASLVGIGTTTPAYTLQIIDSASTTITIGSPTLTGCFIMGDSDGAGISYITVLNGVLSATTTQPSICQ